MVQQGQIDNLLQERGEIPPPASLVEQATLQDLDEAYRRSVEDPELVDELVERGIFLNVCPWSNVLLGLYPSREAHPIRTLVDAGARVTLNTDGSGFYRITLEDEYVTASEVYGWSADVLRQLARTSVEASFCPEPRRGELLAAIDAFDFAS